MKLSDSAMLASAVAFPTLPYLVARAACSTLAPSPSSADPRKQLILPLRPSVPLFPIELSPKSKIHDKDVIEFGMHMARNLCAGIGTQLAVMVVNANAFDLIAIVHRQRSTNDQQS